MDTWYWYVLAFWAGQVLCIPGFRVDAKLVLKILESDHEELVGRDDPAQAQLIQEVEWLMADLRLAL